MIRFLIKGVLRDRSRSLLPVLIVSAGVALTVFMMSYAQGAFGEMVEVNARFSSGHVKVMTQGFAKEESMTPNDLALDDVNDLTGSLNNMFPEMVWHPRIRFGGLLDVPDQSGETRAQGPVFGLGLQLFSAASQQEANSEAQLFNLKKALVKGKLPGAPGEALISQKYSQKLGVHLNDTVTLISSTMYGGMAVYNFKVVGNVNFGIAVLDRGTLIADITDVQQALEMDDAASEVLGFFRDGQYNEEKALFIKKEFNDRFRGKSELSPEMVALSDLPMLKDIIAVGKIAWGLVIIIFLTAMSIVLWNSGLMSGLRRYGEIGIRLAMGETKGHIYRSLLAESLIIAILGSFAGTAIGLAFSYYLQYKGIDIGYAMKSSSLLMSNVLHAKVTPLSYYIGFVPGILATFIGTALSGIGIYRRQTAQLFKELEV